MPTRLIAIAVFAFGVMLGCGSIGEITLAMHPSLLPPDALKIPFMAAHQTSWGLRGWMIGANLVNLACALTFLVAAVALLRHDARGWARLRAAAGVLGAVALVGVPVCLRYLLPIESGPGRDGSIVMLASVVGAAAGLAAFCLGLVALATRALRRSPAHF